MSEFGFGAGVSGLVADAAGQVRCAEAAIQEVVNHLIKAKGETWESPSGAIFETWLADLSRTAGEVLMECAELPVLIAGM